MGTTRQRHHRRERPHCKRVASHYRPQPRGSTRLFLQSSSIALCKPTSRHSLHIQNEVTKQPLYTYTVTIDSVETLTGIDFLYNLPDSLENYIEQNIDLQSWQL